MRMIWLAAALWLLVPGNASAAETRSHTGTQAYVYMQGDSTELLKTLQEEYGESDGAMLQDSGEADSMTEQDLDALTTADGLSDYIDLDAIETGLAELTDTGSYSFRETVKSLLRGEIPFDLNSLPGLLADALLAEVMQQRQIALRILLVVLASAIFSNFIHMLENSQIAEISFFMMYLLICVMLMRSFSVMSGIVEHTCGNICGFMKILLPSYLVAVVVSSGTVTALGFYEVTVLAMNLLQVFLVRIVLPAINFYLALLVLNQLSKEDFFSKLASLVEMVTGWLIKTILTAVLGLQAVQCLTAPAVDSLKNSALHRLAKAIPGVGSVIDSAAETVAGSAAVIKNAVGVAGILALCAICLPPILRLAAGILIYRLLCALIQPFSDKRMVEGIESVARGAGLLLRTLVASVSVFIISIAMITASVKGG